MNVIVIGAGATGLAAAYLLARSGARVTVLEAAPQPGGLLATFDAGGGVRLETFYHHFFTHDVEINWLLEELELARQVHFAPTTMGIARDGKIFPFNGPLDLLRFDAIPWPARVRFGVSAALLTYVPGFARDEHTPALTWLRRWAGQAATEAIWEPMMRVKFGDAAERIPLAWMAGRLRQRARSRKGVEERLGYLEGSLQVLVDRLVQVLEQGGVAMHTATPVHRFLLEKGRVVGVQTAEETLRADAVLATVPTPILADLVEEVDADYAESLRRIRYMGALCTVLAFPEAISPVYWLNVADPGYTFGGVIEQTRLVPAEQYGGLHLVYLSRYVDWAHPLWSLPDDALLARQLPELERLLGRPLRDRLLQHWVFRGRYAAPVTDLGFSRRVPAFRAPVEGLFVATMPHVYPDERSTNNSIRIAAGAIEAMGITEHGVPEGQSLAGEG